jgi:hypothetical protein
MGRPRADIDKTQFEKLCALQCTEEEILAWFHISDKTLCSWCKRTYGKSFSEIFKEKRKVGKISLRRSQFRLAEKSAAMAIFLGKNYLGQTDAKEVRAEVTATEREQSKLDSILAQITEDDEDDGDEV